MEAHFSIQGLSTIEFQRSTARYNTKRYIRKRFFSMCQLYKKSNWVKQPVQLSYIKKITQKSVVPS